VPWCSTSVMVFPPPHKPPGANLEGHTRTTPRASLPSRARPNPGFLTLGVDPGPSTTAHGGPFPLPKDPRRPRADTTTLPRRADPVKTRVNRLAGATLPVAGLDLCPVAVKTAARSRTPPGWAVVQPGWTGCRRGQGLPAPPYEGRPTLPHLTPPAQIPRLVTAGGF